MICVTSPEIQSSSQRSAHVIRVMFSTPTWLLTAALMRGFNPTEDPLLDDLQLT